MTKSLSTETLALLILLGLTLGLWILRGFALLAFLPSGIFWLLIMAIAALLAMKLIRWTI